MTLNIYKNKKGYSLVEILVSLGILAIVITMLFNVLIVATQSSLKLIARSVVREELATISGLMLRDIRNSEKIVSCGEASVQNTCEFFKNNIRYRWSKCTNDTTRVCKYDLTNLASPVINYQSSPNLNITVFDFSQGFGGTNETDTAASVLFTIVASHDNTYVNISNVFRQTSISTRNFRY